MKKQQPSLSLSVLNSEMLASGTAANCLFGIQGGVVGSSEGNTWALQDRHATIEPTVFNIKWRDGAFCLQRMTPRLLINQSVLVDGVGAVRLQQGDEITVGTLSIRVYISLHGLADTYDSQNASPESLVSSYHNPLDAMLEQENVSSHNQQYQQSEQRALAATVANSFSQDPLRVLQTESLTTLNDTLESADAIQSLHAKNIGHISFSSPLSDIAKDKAMDQAFIDLPQITSSFAEDDAKQNGAEREQLHVAVTPLMRGLGAQIPIHNSQEAHDFLEEIGRTMKAAISGLLALQREQHGLSDKHLRPLEDNPLRLNLDYDTTLDVLFADQKSPVHLAAPAAVEESLHNLQLHHHANQAAIFQALTTMLDAFSPSRLLTRFAQYRRSGERQETDSAWAWDMYCSYYQELSSGRQQGFEKLFWEVYAQAYDRDLRQQQQESKA